MHMSPRVTRFDHTDLSRRYSVTISHGLNGQCLVCSDRTHICFCNLGAMRRVKFHDDPVAAHNFPRLPTSPNTPTLPNLRYGTSCERPDLSSDDLVDSLVGNTMFFSQIHDRQGWLTYITLTNQPSFLRSEFHWPCSSTSNHVNAVVSLVALAKMIRAAANWIVALVQDIILCAEVTICEFISYATCDFPTPCNAASALDFHQGRTVVADSLLTNPRPTARTTPDLIPKECCIDRTGSEIFHKGYATALHGNIVYPCTPIKSITDSHRPRSFTDERSRERG